MIRPSGPTATATELQDPCGSVIVARPSPSNVSSTNPSAVKRATVVGGTPRNALSTSFPSPCRATRTAALGKSVVTTWNPLPLGPNDASPEASGRSRARTSRECDGAGSYAYPATTRLFPSATAEVAPSPLPKKSICRLPSPSNDGSSADEMLRNVTARYVGDDRLNASVTKRTQTKPTKRSQKASP